MLRRLIARDGGVLEAAAPAAPDRTAMAAALARPGADAVLVAGRSGSGADDEAPLALAEAGEVALHGIALRPGGSLGLGRMGKMPVVLLPGEPLDCLVAYELVAGRLISRLAGLPSEPPPIHRTARLTRKIVSAIGITDLCRIRLAGDLAEPLGVGEAGGILSAARSDGFVLVPEALEGYPPGATVSVYLWR
jgi:molybdopterin molybdotransferase